MMFPITKKVEIGTSVFSVFDYLSTSKSEKRKLMMKIQLMKRKEQVIKEFLSTMSTRDCSMTSELSYQKIKLAYETLTAED